MRGLKSRLDKIEKGRRGGIHFFQGHWDSEDNPVTNEAGEIVYTYMINGEEYTEAEIEMFQKRLNGSGIVFIGNSRELANI